MAGAKSTIATGRTVDEMRDVLMLAFRTFKILAENSMLPGERRLAARRAGNCLWALGIDEAFGYSAQNPVALGAETNPAATEPIRE